LPSQTAMCQMCGWPLTNQSTEKKDRLMSDVSFVVEIILRITRAYKRKHTQVYFSVWKYTLLQHK
jgi:hypothetical protein